MDYIYANLAYNIIAVVFHGHTIRTHELCVIMISIMNSIMNPYVDYISSRNIRFAMLPTLS